MRFIVLLLLFRWRESTTHRYENPQSYNRSLESDIHYFEKSQHTGNSHRVRERLSGKVKTFKAHRTQTKTRKKICGLEHRHHHVCSQKLFPSPSQPPSPSPSAFPVPRTWFSTLLYNTLAQVPDLANWVATVYLQASLLPAEKMLLRAEELACCKTKQNPRRRRATSVPSAK